jgi:DegV family protein with EDD domain
LIRILTNPGANLPSEEIARYDIALTSSSIVVDGKTHDAREGVTMADVDRWVETAREHPYVLGTSAAEFVKRYVDLGATEGNEVVVMMSSRKIIQSYDAACSAARTLAAKVHAAPVSVIDTGMTDLGLGLPVLAAAKAVAAGLALPEVITVAEAMAAGGRFAFVPRTLDNLVRGGRAGFLRSWLANVLGVRPVLSFVDGEAALSGKCSVKADPALVIADWMARELPGGGPVWTGVCHGGAPDDAERLAALLRERFDVALALVREISSTVYLHAGPRSLGAVVFPLAGLPWRPPPP